MAKPRPAPVPAETTPIPAPDSEERAIAPTSARTRTRALLAAGMARVDMERLAQAAREYGDSDEEAARELADLEAGRHPLQRTPST